MIDSYLSKITIEHDVIKLYTINNDKISWTQENFLFQDENYCLVRHFSVFEDNKLLRFYLRCLKLRLHDKSIEFTPNFEYNLRTHSEEFEYYFLLKKDLESDIIKFMEKLGMFLELKK